MGDNQIPGAATGLYTGPSEDSFKPITPEIKPEPVVSSQNEIDLSQYREKLVPTKSTVEKNWVNGFNDSPSLVMAQEIKHRIPSKPKAPDIPKIEEIIEKPDTDLAKRNASLEEQNAELKARLENIESMLEELKLQNALDPRQRTSNPLEDVQKTLLEQEDERQRKFAQDVEDKRMKHDPTYNPNLVPPVTPPLVKPELTNQTAAETAEKERKERNLKRVALIAGVVVGGVGGALGGTPVAGIGALACAGAGIITRIVEYRVGRRIEKLSAQLNITTDVEQRTKLEKMINNRERVIKGTQYAMQFFKGATIGFTASGMAMGIFNAGHGLVWNRPDIPTGIPATNAEASIGRTGTEQPIGTETPLPSSSETYQGNSFIHDDRVDLSGSAWDGIRAGGPAQDTLAGGAENSSNYIGGASEMAANQLRQDLASNNITDQLLSNLTTYDKHRLLTEYWNTVRGGNPNPDFIGTLKSMNTDGARKLLEAIGK